jgi:hypothetical protein
MNIDTLNKQELTSLQQQIAERIETIDREQVELENRKNSVKKKTMLKQLTKQDAIFGISFDSDGKPVRIGLCDVLSVEIDSKFPEFYTVAFNHKTLPLGVYNHCVPKERGDKHYCLLDSYFFTLKPKTWRTDMAEALEDRIARIKINQAADIKKIKNRISNCFKNAEYVQMVNNTMKEIL